MNIVCVICSDLLIPSDDVFHTPCGHIFHFVCLTQWLERSKTCPQCREKSTSNKIHRVYFNFANSDTINEDRYSLQDKVDKLNFQLMLKEKDITVCTEKSKTLEKQNEELKKEIRKVESELNEKYSAIYGLKEQIKYFKTQNLETENKNKEIAQLQKKIENYKNIQILLEASIEDVEEMISRACDSNTLITYISVMKREMTISLNKRRELRSKLRSLQQELTKVSMERNFLSEEHTRRKKLEEDLMTCESEKMLLQTKLGELEKNISLMQKSNNFNVRTVDSSNSDSCNCNKQCKVKAVVDDTKNKKKDMNQENSEFTVTKNEQNSPYLPVKSIGVFASNQHTTQKNSTISSSILLKKARFDQISAKNEQVTTNTLSYNGLGGHSKLEHFPSYLSVKVKKVKDDGIKFKRQKFEMDNNNKN